MAPSVPVEKKFSILCDITRAQHFAWREAVAKLAPDVDPMTVVKAMWEITGVQTARAYLKRIDGNQPLAPQLAASICWSSDCMGETAHVEAGAAADEAYVRHTACPWKTWHERNELLHEDRPGCDAWFQSMVDTINQQLGSKLRVETQKALPDGDDCCLRRIWSD